MIQVAIIFYKFFCKDDRIQWKNIKIYGIYNHDHIIIETNIFIMNNLAEYTFFVYNDVLYQLKSWQIKERATNYFEPTGFKIQDKFIDSL